MSLKVTKGVSNRPLVPKRLKIIALLFLILASMAILLSPTVNIFHQKSDTLSTTAEKTATTAKNTAAKPSTNTIKTAKIVTCPRCRLNALPLVKKFVYQHAKSFEPNLKVDFIIGEDPVLHLYENGKQVSEVDLAPLDWKQIIQKLVAFGIKPTTETAEIRQALST